MSDYYNFWNNERLKLYAKYAKHHYLFHMQNLFQNGANDISEMANIISRFFVRKDPNFVQFARFDFVQILLVVKIASKELPIVFGTYTVSNSNGSMKSLKAKICVKN